MTTQSERGFTIIEVVLFLAITGALLAGLMIGVNAGITQQRYLDSVRSYKGFLQEQYSEVLNTRNSRDNEWRCDGSGAAQDSSSNVTPGTSDCVILGRKIQITDNGRSLRVANVTGRITAAAAAAGERSEDLTVYQPKVLPQSSPESEKWDVDWGSRLRLDATTDFSVGDEPVILILRSPGSGVLRVFTSPAEADLVTMVKPENTAAYTTVLCHYIEGDSGAIPKQWIRVNPAVGAADGVTVSEGGCNA